MPNGYSGNIFRVNLSNETISVEQPDDVFYRRYLGGWGFVAYYLLKELEPGTDALSPQNKLFFAPGVVTGAPFGGSDRITVGGKSPLTGAFGAAECGGYLPSMLKLAGVDTIIVEGQAESPVYLWVHDGQVEIRNATHLWGLDTGDTLDVLRKDLDNKRVSAAMIGPGGENLVRFACVMNGLKDAAGRTGMGAIMGSKRLKAVAAFGRGSLETADPETIRTLAAKLAKSTRENPGGLSLLGTGGDLTGGVESGNLPTNNFRDGLFPEPKRISSAYWKEHGIMTGMEGCLACPVRCKKVVKIDGRFKVDPKYGGPEYETEAALGSNCGVTDEEALCKGNELCNRYSLDTISTGVSIAFAMECYEKGLLTKEDTGGIDLRFGNGDAMVKMVRMIGDRKGLGDLLAEGCMRAAEKIGKGAAEYAVHVKGQEFPMHEPRLKRGMAIGYSVSPTGADHVHSLHDTGTVSEAGISGFKPFGVYEPVPLEEMGASKIRIQKYHTQWRAMMNSLVFCIFPSWTKEEIVQIVNAVTGWQTTGFELMKTGQRILTMARVFNLREGFTVTDDWLPPRMFQPATCGPLSNTPVDEEELKKARSIFYGMMGWNRETGVPTADTLGELDISWVEQHLPT
ncbi:MAG: aldehyde ferredoxin oxidoreductase family protein [Candidatus Bathyarchaeia archaeon]